MMCNVCFTTSTLPVEQAHIRARVGRYLDSQTAFTHGLSQAVRQALPHRAKVLKSGADNKALTFCNITGGNLLVMSTLDKIDFETT
jgi:hypothetical protein